MKFSKRLLKQWIDFNLPSEDLLERLTLAGFEAESVQKIGLPFSGVKIGYILACAPHPHADRLQVASVDIGSEKTLSIVCGALNCRSHMKVACAVEGAHLPNARIEQRKLRGVLSEGMLCSSGELGFLDPQGDGILELPADAPLGMELHEYWNLAEDEWLQVNVMPNRGDCLGHYGLAKELASILDLSLRSSHDDETITKPPTSSDITITLTDEAKANISQLQMLALHLENPKAMTPAWMQFALRCAGLNILLHPVLNILNYVMLEVGQPLHAYRAQQVHPELHFRTAYPNETVCLLNQTTVTLPESALLVTSEEKALCLAGIMGTAAAAIQETDAALLIEAAQFNPTCIAQSARSLQLNTEASYRFERGVPSELGSLALARVASLATAICGGEAYRREFFAKEAHSPLRIELQQKLLRSRVGVSFSSESVEAYLRRVFCQVQKTTSGWIVLPPTHRSDLRLPEDLIEEIVRLHGYHNLPPSLPTIKPQIAPLPKAPSLCLHRIKERLFARGYQEVINYSFIPQELAKLFSDAQALISLINPISREMNTLRPHLLPSLLQTAEHNLKRQAAQVQCFEIGPTFVRSSDATLGTKETVQLGCLALGKRYDMHWLTPDRTAWHSFFSIKALLEELLILCRIHPSTIHVAPSAYSYLHPHQQANLICSSNGLLLGSLGQLHPRRTKELNCPYAIFYGQLNLESIPPCQSQNVDSSYSRFPFIQHNLSFILRKEIASSEVMTICKEIGGPQLKQLIVFDRYIGPELAEGTLALGITFIWQDLNRTLREEEISHQEKKIIAALAQTFGATLRGYET